MTLSDREILAFVKLKVLIKDSNPDLPNFLNWLWKRLYNVYHENPNVDYMHTLKHVAKELQAIQREAFPGGVVQGMDFDDE